MTDGPAAPLDLRLLEAFLNTVDERTFRRHGAAHAGGDLLTSPAALQAWLSGRGLAPGAAVSEADLAAALRLRAALRQALLAGSVPALVEFPLHLAPDPDGALRLTAAGSSPLGPLVETVAAAVVRGTWARVKICPMPDCHWAFYDESRSGAGRWCSTEVCGNRAKTRQYRERRRVS